MFYVGKGQKDRISAHESEARGESQHPKCQRIRDIWNCGLEVVRRKVKTFVDAESAYAFEVCEIARIGRAKLTNLTDGGGGREIGKKPVEPIEVARQMCKYIAAAVVMRAKGQKFSVESINEVQDYLLTVTTKRLWLKFGTEFMSGELAKYGIEAKFPNEAEQVQA